MAAGNVTRRMFADVMENMLKNTDLDKIRVSEICRLCDTSPRVFYYHFKDKYDLAAWIFLQDLTSVFGEGNRELEQRKTEALMKKYLRRRNFYRKVLADQSQNSVYYYVIESFIKIGEASLEKQTGRPLTVQERLEIRMHNYGMVNLLRDWIMTGLDGVTAKELVEFFHVRTPEALGEALTNADYREEEVFS